MPDPTTLHAIELRLSGDQRAELAAMAFLAGYTKNTRTSYALDLRRWLGFCEQLAVDPFTARRAHIETFGRQMEAQGRAPATVARRLSTICVWYAYLEAEDMIAKSPARFVRRPKVSMESTTLGLDRAQLGAILYTAERARPNEYALVAVLGVMDRRVSDDSHLHRQPG